MTGFQSECPCFPHRWGNQEHVTMSKKVVIPVKLTTVNHLFQDSKTPLSTQNRKQVTLNIFGFKKVYPSQEVSWGRHKAPKGCCWFLQIRRRASDYGRLCLWYSSPLTGTSWSAPASRQNILGPNACEHLPLEGAVSP